MNYIIVIVVISHMPLPVGTATLRTSRCCGLSWVLPERLASSSTHSRCQSSPAAATAVASSAQETPCYCLVSRSTPRWGIDRVKQSYTGGSLFNVSGIRCAMKLGETGHPVSSEEGHDVHRSHMCKGGLWVQRLQQLQWIYRRVQHWNYTLLPLCRCIEMFKSDMVFVNRL